MDSAEATLSLIKNYTAMRTDNVPSTETGDSNLFQRVITITPITVAVR